MTEHPLDARLKQQEEYGARGAAILDAMAQRANTLQPEVELLSAAKLTPEPVKWLWPGYVAGGKLHILAGQPGTGKTTIALSVAATITRGGYWPDGQRAERGSVLIWSGEDDPLDTLMPRLMAAKADLDRAYLVGDVCNAGGKRAFDPAHDMTTLLLAAEAFTDLRLLVIDPVVSAVAGDSHKNAETRRALQPLVEFAQRTGAAVWGISHFSKGTAGRDPLERLSGSLAFGAMARLVFGAAARKTDDGGEERVFVRIKSNIGPDGGGFAYSLEFDDLDNGVTGSKVIWGEAITAHARDILAECEAQPDEERTATDEAEEWLLEVLRPGPSSAGEIQKQARQAGISEKALRRARERLGIKPRKRDFAGGWC